MIYFITARDINRVKVGWSVDPLKRLKELQTGCPAKCALEATVDCGRDFETEVHRIFYKFRTHGEWFELAPALEMAIRIANGATLDEAHDGFFNEWLAAHRTKVAA